MNFHVWLKIFATLQGAGKVYGQYGDLNGCPQYGSEEFKNLVLDKIEGLTENYEKLKVENMELKDLILKIFSWKEKSTTTMEETKIRVQRVSSELAVTKSDIQWKHEEIENSNIRTKEKFLSVDMQILYLREQISDLQEGSIVIPTAEQEYSSEPEEYVPKEANIENVIVQDVIEEEIDFNQGVISSQRIDFEDNSAMKIESLNNTENSGSNCIDDRSKNVHVNNILNFGSGETIPEWTLNCQNTGKPGTASGTAPHFSRCKNWWCYTGGRGSISTVLHGSGRGKLDYGICFGKFSHNQVKVYVNEERVSTAFGSNNDTSIVIAFDYHDQSILKIEEYGHSTIQFNSFEVVKCYN